MKILLFGVTGLVGTEFEEVSKGHSVTLIGLSHQDIDIRNSDAVRSRIFSEKPDVVINLVAIPSINLCEENPDLACSIHITAPLVMVKACAAKGIVFVQASSHAVFDGTRAEPYTEEDQPNPGSIYAVSKYASERLAANICPRHYIVRFPTMYGKRRNSSPGFVDKMMELLRKDRELRVADDKLDSVSYARDVASCLLQLLVQKQPFGIYHITNSGVTSYYDFVCALKDLLGSNSIVHRAKDKDFPAFGLKPLRTALRSVRLEPMRSWKEALEAYVTTDLRSQKSLRISTTTLKKVKTLSQS